MSLNRKTFANISKYTDGGIKTPKVKQRRGVRKNPNGSVSSHLMRAEYIPERGWVGFPSLFQDSKPYADDNQNWVDMSETPDKDWMSIYEEANRRGEVYDFGEDKEAALAFGKGSWKNQLPTKADGGEIKELTDDEIKEYRDGGYVVEEYAEGGIITGGPEVNSHYGLIGKLGYANQFRGTRDRSTVHELAAEIYGGKKGKPFVGASGSYEFGSVQNNRLRNKNFFKAAVGIDPIRGGSFDITAGSKFPIVKTRDNEVNVTPFGGFSGQSRAYNTVNAEHNSYDENKVGLTYGVGADWKHKSGFGVYGSVNARTGMNSDQSKADMDKMNFGLDAKVGATYNLPIYDKNRKIKKIIAAQKKKTLNTSHPRFTTIDRTNSPSIMKNGGQVLDLTDLEIAEYEKGGYIVEEYADGGEHGDILTYKNNADYFDSHTNLHENSAYNKQIKERVYSGNWGFNPKDGTLHKLGKDDRVKVSNKTRALSKAKPMDKAVKPNQSGNWWDNPNYKPTQEETNEFVRMGVGKANSAFKDAISMAPGIETLADAAGLVDATIRGDKTDMGIYTAGLALPFVPGGILKKGKKALKKIDLTDALQKIKAKNIIDDDVLKKFLEASDDIADLSKKAPATKSEINWGKWNKEIPKNKVLMKEYDTIEKATKANGTWMKNSNGTKFQGTPEQFVQQNSKNFKKAFPNILKENGNPSVLLHRSSNKFNSFDESKNLSGVGADKYGKGIYTMPKSYSDKYEAKSISELGPKKPVYTHYGNNSYHLYANDIGVNQFSKRPKTAGVPSYKTDIHTVVSPYDNPLKSAIGNNGMFDMSNPNIKAGMDGNFITRPLTPFSKNELASKPGRNMNYRKIGNEQGLRDLINKGGAQAPGPLKMNSGQTIDTPFFGTGQNPTESYKGLFAVEVDPLNPKYNWSSTVGGTSNYGKAPFDVNTGKLVKNIPLEDLNVYRKKWFSNNYKKLDKNNLKGALKNAQAQRLTEGAFKWGVRGLAADYMLNNGKGTDTVGNFLTHQDGGEIKHLTKAQIKKYRDGGYIVEEY